MAGPPRPGVRAVPRHVGGARHHALRPHLLPSVPRAIHGLLEDLSAVHEGPGQLQSRSGQSKIKFKMCIMHC